MAAPLRQRFFSLELLVDRVHLEAGILPPSVTAEEEKEEMSSPPPASSLCLAVAFRLLDFPTLLVYPPGGPAAPAPELRPGVVCFGRGKSCLFRLHPDTLHHLLLRIPLYALLLHLPPGRPTPAPQILGNCSISLGTAVQKVLGPTGSSGSHGHRGSYHLRNPMGERIGDIALGYRLTDLGSGPLGHLERPVTTTGSGVKGLEVEKVLEVSSQNVQEKQLQHPTLEPNPRDADRRLVGVKMPKTQKDLKEIVSNSDNTGSVENGKTSSVVTCPNASSSSSPLNQEVTELDIETNTFCPPPLYYTHLTPQKIPPAQGRITFVPQMNVSEKSEGIFQEEKLVNGSTHGSPLKHVTPATRESPKMLMNPPTRIEEIGASSQTTCHSQTEQNKINTIRQLPLLNALLVELSLLYNQPIASPTHIHPHLAWLYRPEDKKAPESTARSTCKAECKKDKLSMGGNEKSVSLQYEKNQVENLKKGIYFEKNSGNSKKGVPRGRLLYGLTNTLKLRLKQTNPEMLVVHEKREQYRKMQAQMRGIKLRIPSSKVKVLSFAEEQKQCQLPEDKSLDSGASFVENNDTSSQISGVFDDPDTTRLKCATEKKTIDYGENRTSNGSLEEIKSPTESIIPEKVTHKNILEGKPETKIQSPCVFQQDVVVDRIVIGKETDDRQVKTTDDNILIVDRGENKVSKNSCSESISELKYSDDFTSPCYSEDFSTTEDNSRSIQTCNSSPGIGKPKHSQSKSKSSESKLFIRKNSSEKSSILSPPFSVGSPVYSSKRSHISKTKDKSLEEASITSTSDLSSLYWTQEKEKQIDQNSMHNSNVKKKNQDISIKLKTRTGCRSLEKSQSPRTSQVSSYLPSNLSELELNALDSCISDQFEEDKSEVGSLNISKQCKDICELVINKLPGYTV
ncbi:microtubule-associated protein 10 [Dasypus novemcinctus]|uniref:microtubule-associated protein 10 n=1 Tax=Dasypus novemcinctus TaxID=9361 RepID=UPI00265DDC5F|nr:microtubule-associated protein 10 [Dasypus novemcinctus]